MPVVALGAAIAFCRDHFVAAGASDDVGDRSRHAHRGGRGGCLVPHRIGARRVASVAHASSCSRCCSPSGTIPPLLFQTSRTPSYASTRAAAEQVVRLARMEPDEDWVVVGAPELELEREGGGGFTTWRTLCPLPPIGLNLKFASPSGCGSGHKVRQVVKPAAAFPLELELGCSDHPPNPRRAPCGRGGRPARPPRGTRGKRASCSSGKARRDRARRGAATRARGRMRPRHATRRAPIRCGTRHPPRPPR